MKFKDFIWDFDGTFMDTYPQIVKCYEFVLSDYGKKMDMDKILEMLIYKSSKETIKYIEAETGITEADFRKGYRKYSTKDESLDLIVPNKGTLELAKFIAKEGGRNFIATDRDETVLKLLKKYDAREVFTDVTYIGSHGITKSKPSTDLFDYLIEKYDIKNKDTLVLGDRELDVIMAHKFDMKACIYRPIFDYKEKADYVISSFDEVKNIILDD